MQPSRLIGICAGVALLAAAANAQAADTFKIDPDHTNVAFGVGHLGYSTMYGQFQAVGGTIEFDEANAPASSLEVSIETASVDTDHQARDDHLRSPDFFNSEEFPEMTFKSTSIERTGDNTGKITGDLTLLGVTKPVTLDVTFNKMAVHPIPSYNGVVVAGFSAMGKINRSEFGMDKFIPGIGDEVQIWIEAEAHKQ